MKKILVIIFSIIGFSVSAKDIEILTIGNDNTTDITTLILNTDDQTDLITGFTKLKRNTRGKALEKIEYPGDLDAFIDDGFVIEKKKKYKVVVIKGLNFDPSLGGGIILDTLANGVTDKRNDYYIELIKSTDSQDWEVIYQEKRITKIFFKVKKLPLVGVVGIDEMVAE